MPVHKKVEVDAVSRRDFFDSVGRIRVMLVAVKVLGCDGSRSKGLTSNVREDVVPPAQTVTIYDVQMEGWSNLGSGMLGMLPDPLLATLIAANVTITLNYTQDPHGHQFTLSQAQLLRLRHGERVEVDTTFALDHNHKVVIDPIKNRVQGTQLVVPYNPDATTSGEPVIFASVTQDDAPVILATAKDKGVKVDQMEICVGSTSQCTDEATIWNPMNKVSLSNGTSAYSFNDTQLILTGESPIDLSVRARVQGMASRLLQRLQLKPR